MEQTGMTRKQFWVQIVPFIFYLPVAVIWIIDGVEEKKPAILICGSVYLAFLIAYLVYLILQRKRHPIDDARLDEEITTNMKEGMKGMGIFLGIVSVCFLVAFGLVAILS